MVPSLHVARDTTRVQYKFYLDRLRVHPKTKERRDWFRKDFGGSIPVRDDVKLLRSILGDHEIFDILERTALKFQTVKASVKGENPGDFIEGLSPAEVVDYLRKLHIPPRQYILPLGPELFVTSPITHR